MLVHLGPVTASYTPRDLHVQAIQVTRENIGKLSLEFETELRYADGGLPYFHFWAKRFDETQPDGQEPPVVLNVRLGDWIVALWGELHIYRDADFINTFTVDESAHRTSWDQDGAYNETITHVPNSHFTVTEDGGVQDHRQFIPKTDNSAKSVGVELPDIPVTGF
jgi:hypothetical protein